MKREEGKKEDRVNDGHTMLYNFKRYINYSLLRFWWVLMSSSSFVYCGNVWMLCVMSCMSCFSFCQLNKNPIRTKTATFTNTCLFRTTDRVGSCFMPVGQSLLPTRAACLNTSRRGEKK